MEKNRSIGVVIFGVTSLLISSYWVFSMHHLSLIGRLIFCISLVILVINLLLLKEWARLLYILFQVLHLVVTIVMCFGILAFAVGNAAPFIVLGALLLLGYFTGSIFFFTRPEVNEQFR